MVLQKGLEETTFIPFLFSLDDLPFHLKPAKYIAKGKHISFPSKDSVFPCYFRKYMGRWKLTSTNKAGVSVWFWFPNMAPYLSEVIWYDSFDFIWLIWKCLSYAHSKFSKFQGKENNQVLGDNLQCYSKCLYVVGSIGWGRGHWWSKDYRKIIDYISYTVLYIPTTVL